MALDKTLGYNINAFLIRSKVQKALPQKVGTAEDQ